MDICALRSYKECFPDRGIPNHVLFAGLHRECLFEGNYIESRARTPDDEDLTYILPNTIQVGLKYCFVTILIVILTTTIKLIVFIDDAFVSM